MWSSARHIHCQLAFAYLFRRHAACRTSLSQKPSFSSQHGIHLTNFRLIYGTWYSYPLGNPDTDSIRHEFRHNQSTNKDEMIVTRLCPGDYRAVIARRRSPIEVTQSTIRVLKSATDTEKGEVNSECKASVESGLWSYTVSDDHNRLTITNPGGSPDIMELARQDSGFALTALQRLRNVGLAHPDRPRYQVQIRLIFYATADPSEGKVRQIATCMKGNDTLVSQVDSDIRVSEDHSEF